MLAKVSVEFEDAILEGRHVVGAAVDFAKAFDNVPTAIALSVLKHLGMHPRILNPTIGMYASLKRRFKIKGYSGEMFRATNGIMQGCPLSVLVLNAMVSVLSKAMAEKVPSLIDQSYVDDMTLLASTENDLKDAFGVMVPYLEATMQELNVTKTYVFHVNHLLPEIIINDMRLPSKEKVFNPWCYLQLP